MLLPGDPDTRTGGYIYDARLRAGLGVQGWDVRLHRLHDGFPQPGRAALAHADAVLAGLPDDAVVLVDGLAFGAMPQTLDAHRRRLRLVALVHHPLAAETGLQEAVRSTLRDSERHALAMARHVVVSGHATARELIADYGVEPARVSVVEPGTDAAALSPERSGDACRMLCVATLTPRKGHAVLLYALSRLSDLDWRLCCVGSPHRDAATATRVQQQARDTGLDARVEFLGERDDAGLERLYADADLLVLATLHEGYGMALAEALARGLPIVSTTAGAVPDTVGPHAGLLVAPGDPSALAMALRRFMTEPGLSGRLRAGALRRRAELPNWEQTCSAMAVVLDAVAEAT